MAQMFGSRWTKHYGLQDSDNVWFAALSDLYPDQIRIGLRNVSRANLDWPPSAPEFRKYCYPSPEELGLPELKRGWREVVDHCHNHVKHSWSHYAVYLSGQYAGWFDVRNATTDSEQKRVRERFEDEYRRLCLKVMRNEPLEPVKTLADQRTPQNDHSEKQLASVMEEQGIDPKGGRAEYLKRMRGMLK